MTFYNAESQNNQLNVHKFLLRQLKYELKISDYKSVTVHIHTIDLIAPFNNSSVFNSDDLRPGT